MKKIYSKLARFVTFVTLPIIGLIVHNSRRVRVVVLAEDQILLQRTSVGAQKWSIPGGGVERHETDEQAVVRELAEEVGLKVKTGQIKKIGEDYRAGSRHKRWPRFTRVYFVIRLPRRVEPKITRPLEILEAQWFLLSDLPQEGNATLETALKLLSRTSRA